MKNSTMRYIYVICLLSFSLQGDAQSVIKSEAEWIDSVYNSLTLDQKIAQLFMLRAYSKQDNADVSTITKLIKEYQIGGLCFFQGSPYKQWELAKQYQEISKTPMLIAIDGEWGLGMRFPGQTLSFPRQLTLGAHRDDNLIYEMGREIARQLKAIGVHVNFAPVADVNNNPANPVIGDRSFGEDKYNVTAKAIAYMKGLQDEGVMACAKHFPGHGDTDVDSHYDLPVIKHNMDRLQEIELYPFKKMIEAGVQGIMVAHLNIPAIDDRPNRPTTLSPKAVRELLKEKMKFDGLVFTDALDMKGVTKFFKQGEADAEAFLAGNDILLLSENIPKAIAAIKDYMQKGSISDQQLEKTVKKILSSKYRLVVSAPSYTVEQVEAIINSPKAIALKSKLIENAITLVKDSLDLIPVKEIKGKKILSIALGTTSKNAFQKRLEQYVESDFIQGSLQGSAEFRSRVVQLAKNKDLVIVSLHGLSKSQSSNYGIGKESVELLKSLNKSNRLVVCVMGSPYAIAMLGDIQTLLVGYEDDNLFQDQMVQSLFGATDIRGKLPVGSGIYPYETGIEKAGNGRLGFGIPERVGMDSRILKQIDTIVQEILVKKVAPGCQILIAKNQKVVYHESFGDFDYSGRTKVDIEHVYDLASVTKVMATTMAVMKLYDDKKLDLNSPLGYVMPHLDSFSIADLKIEELLSHYSGLKAWIPFYKQTIIKNGKSTKANPKYYQPLKKDLYYIPVARNMFMKADFADSLKYQIYQSQPQYDNKKYVYSDLGFILLADMVKFITFREFDEYLNQHFYEPLGMRNTLFNPLERIPVERIAPTENDNYWRHQKLQGYVHDMAAAMFGGVSGHAGLFSTTLDVAMMMQMLLNEGRYGGEKFLNSSTIQLFTRRANYSSRRGLGFDMKELNPRRAKNTGQLASDMTYGHLGFTGTCVWVDPKHQLVFVFLSNRTYPDMDNNRMNKLKYRPRIQDIAYKSFLPEYKLEEYELEF
jgi:beta-N-acetylhexosaminidase